CFFLFRNSNRDFARRSIKVGGWIGLAGLLLCMFTGDGSAVEVTRTQPMKLAAMEGLYEGSEGQSLVTLGLINPDKKWDNNEDPYLFEISLPKGLSILARHDMNAYVPGISDIINGVDVIDGDTINTVSYEDRIRRGRIAQSALREYGMALREGNVEATHAAQQTLVENYQFFGYGYFNSPAEAIPPVALTFYSFRVMVMLGSYFLLFYVVVLFLAYKAPKWLTDKKWLQIVAMISVPLMYICSEAGWIVAEVGRQPWTVQDLLPVGAAISDIPSSSVMITFWMFAILFTVLLCAEVGIMIKWVLKATHSDIDNQSNK
ncbi:MAG: cytochrome ubiquinol oxidase subunit I, partial [Muribaculaceae bacterium]|nr:cytochrome ubiquinol oxidase subunit I [Muribaculaceae bacterium]